MLTAAAATCVVFLLLSGVNTLDLTYIVKNKGNVLVPSCVAQGSEKYEAIGWVYPIPSSSEGIPKIESSYVPNYRNDFDCGFSYNEPCTRIWNIKNWEIDKSTRAFDYIIDKRWEAFPTLFISNKTKEFKERVELPATTFNVGFSLRTSDKVELFVCEGWDPYSYPCYLLNIEKTAITLLKIPALPKNNVVKQTTLDEYKTFSTTLSENEWRNFILSHDNDGLLQLIDKTVNRTVIEFKDATPLRPMFLLFRSQQPSLWKIHQNEFLYTKSTQVSRLGPMLMVPQENLCLSLFISTCDNCVMSFFINIDGQKENLLQESSKKTKNWTFVKLRRPKLVQDKINIFVQTSFLKPDQNTSEGFWAIDDIRVCDENEIKVTSVDLDLQKAENEHSVSCQVINHPNWRPKKLVFEELQGKLPEFPEITSTSTSNSITLEWSTKGSNSQVDYFIKYQGKSDCEEIDQHRLKSNGFIVTKSNNVTIEKLHPFTTYNVTFSTILHAKVKHLEIKTLETDTPTLEEWKTIQIRVTATSANISWAPIPCPARLGNLVHVFKYVDKSTNETKEIYDITGNGHVITGLKPFTKYRLSVLTSRSLENAKNGVRNLENVQEFITEAGLAGEVQNLEIYATNEDSISMRYDLPNETSGVPIEIQIKRCGNGKKSKCKSSVSTITRCFLFPAKYCADVQNLVNDSKHVLKISLRNDGTPIFGVEKEVEAEASEKVPGKTEKISTVSDCPDATSCHLNINWNHPYNQNGSITAFNIILNSSETFNNVTDFEAIHEIFKINNQSYLPQYHYQIKYVPYRKKYNLYIQSENLKYKSDFTMVEVVNTRNAARVNINENPVLLETTVDSFTFKLPTFVQNMAFVVTIIVQDYDDSKKVEIDELKNRKLCLNHGNTWIANKTKVESNRNRTVTISQDMTGKNHLIPNTKYCVTFLMKNLNENVEHDLFFENLELLPSSEDSEPNANVYRYILLVIFVIIAIGTIFVVVRHLKKRKLAKKQARENEYESLPFEDNFVNNNAYDQLRHK